jgi:putative Mn2+ efflux pump MntP
MMPVLGWAAGAKLAPLITSYDHWIAFILLCFVGIHMLRPTSGQSSTKNGPDPSRGLLLLTLATATSIDALATGLSLAMLRVDIWVPSAVIGIITATVSLAGIFIGTRLRSGFGRKAEIVGGLILITIAVKIVLAHTVG